MNKPFHIGLLLQGGRGWLGGFEYIKGIVTSLQSLPAEVRSGFRITLIAQERLKDSDYAQLDGFVDQWLYLADEMPNPGLVQRLRRKIVRRLLRKEYSPLPNILRQHRIDFAYPYMPEVKPDGSFHHASWIPDFQHKHLPEFFPGDQAETRELLFEKSARLSPIVVLSSHDAERDFQRFYPFATQKSRVFQFHTPQMDAWYAADPLEIQREYLLPDKFFLVANQFWKHKNHLLVFKAIKRLAEQGTHPTVVFTGNLSDYRSPDYIDTVLQTIQRWGIHQQVRLLGVVPKTHYVQLLRRSIAVVQPSLFEGWSTIVEDCRSLGKRIILSDLNVHHEQNPPEAAFFNSQSDEELALQMQKAWDQYTPGPDRQAEEVAKRINLNALRTQGERFLKIVWEASHSSHQRTADVHLPQSS